MKKEHTCSFVIQIKKYVIALDWSEKPKSVFHPISKLKSFDFLNEQNIEFWSQAHDSRRVKQYNICLFNDKYSFCCHFFPSNFVEF